MKDKKLITRIIVLGMAVLMIAFAIIIPFMH